MLHVNSSIEEGICRIASCSREIEDRMGSGGNAILRIGSITNSLFIFHITKFGHSRSCLKKRGQFVEQSQKTLDLLEQQGENLNSHNHTDGFMISLENALRRFKRKVQQEDIIKEIKRHSYYLKPGEKRRVKEALARKRVRKKARLERE